MNQPFFFFFKYHVPSEHIWLIVTNFSLIIVLCILIIVYDWFKLIYSSFLFDLFFFLLPFHLSTFHCCLWHSKMLSNIIFFSMPTVLLDLFVNITYWKNYLFLFPGTVNSCSEKRRPRSSFRFRVASSYWDRWWHS